MGQLDIESSIGSREVHPYAGIMGEARKSKVNAQAVLAGYVKYVKPLARL